MVEKIKEFLEQDKKSFQEYVDNVRTHKVKMLNPNIAQKVVVSAGVIAYINELERRIDDLCGE